MQCYFAENFQTCLLFTVSRLCRICKVLLITDEREWTALKTSRASTASCVCLSRRKTVSILQIGHFLTTRDSGLGVCPAGSGVRTTYFVRHRRQNTWPFWQLTILLAQTFKLQHRKTVLPVTSSLTKIVQQQKYFYALAFHLIILPKQKLSLYNLHWALKNNVDVFSLLSKFRWKKTVRI